MSTLNTFRYTVQYVISVNISGLKTIIWIYSLKTLYYDLKKTTLCVL
jgi:hypothetical protein